MCTLTLFQATRYKTQSLQKTAYDGSDIWHNTNTFKTDENKYTCTKNGYLNLQDNKKERHMKHLTKPN